MSSVNLSQKEIYRLFTDSSTHGLTILAVCLAQYGEDVFNIDALELYARIHDDFTVTLDDHLENKLQALIVSLQTDAFETDPSVYDSVVKALTDGDPDIVDPEDDLLLDEMMWAEYEVGLARTPDRHTILPFEFGPLVAGYRARILSTTEGMDDQQLQDIYDVLEENRQQLQNELLSVGFEVSSLPDFI